MDSGVFLPAIVLALALTARPALAAPQSVVFRHIVIVVQENRTPDNLFGSKPHFEPGVDIAASGVNSLHQTIKLTAEPLASCYDIYHYHLDFEEMLTQGADQEQTNPAAGCVLPANPEFKYADNSTGTVTPYFEIARNYGFANRMFQTNQGPSFPAHQFLFAGTAQPSAKSRLMAAENMTNTTETAGCTAPPDQTVAVIDGAGSETSHPAIYPCLKHHTLPDLLDPANISWRYYGPTAGSIWLAPNAVQHICAAASVGGALSCQGKAYQNGSVVPDNPAQVLSDIAACSLAEVSWVIPTREDSDHAGGDQNNGTGPAWVASIVDAIGEQPDCANGENYWDDTVILITWDDWGGWYDHVPPFANNLQPGTPAGFGDGDTYGFRVPLLVVSAYTPKGTVDNVIHDFGTLLYFAEQNYGLGFIGPGGTAYGNYADYQAAARGDTLAAFFPDTAPEPFRKIPAAVGADYFLHAPRSPGGPDDD